MKLEGLFIGILLVTLALSVVNDGNPLYFVKGDFVASEYLDTARVYADEGEEEEEEEEHEDETDEEEEEEEDEQEEDNENENEEEEEEELENEEEESEEEEAEEHEEEDDLDAELPDGSNSEIKLKMEDEGVELEVEIEDGDVPDGTHDVAFTCTVPDVNQLFDDGLLVEYGEGKLKLEIALVPDTYAGCEVEIGDDLLTAVFSPFTVLSDEQEELEEEENESEEVEEELEEEEIEADNEDIESEVETLAQEEEEEDDIEDMQEQRNQEIVSETTGLEIYESHLEAESASTGEYEPGMNYTLTAVGTATGPESDSDISSESTPTPVELSIDLGVWKSNAANVLMDVIGGSVQLGEEEYDVAVGYAIYSVNSDILRIKALVTDDAGNVLELELRGEAATDDDSASLPLFTEDPTFDLTFEGSSGPFENELEGWELSLEGEVQLK